MTKKKIFKIIILIFVLLMIGMIISNNSFAWDIKGDIDAYETADAGNAGKRITGLVGAIIDIASTVGAGIAIIMLIVIGIKYVSAEPGEKASAKKDITAYVIGAVILFGVSGILKLLQMFIDSNLNSI